MTTGNFFRKALVNQFPAALALVSFIPPAFSCTAVNIEAKDGTVVAGRSMERA